LGEPAREWFTASDGYRWGYRRWRPARPPRAHLVCVHGIQSHGGWYEGSCGWFADAGFAVDFLDRRGSGVNEAGRGDAPSFRRLLDDLAEFLKARPRERGVARILMAISWGGKLGAALPYRHSGLIDGLILACPGLFPHVGLSLTERLRLGACRLVAPRRRFAIPLNDPELFTASPEYQKFIADDPLALREATARLLFASNSLNIYLRRARRALRRPVLLLLAEKDRIIDNERTRRWLDTLPAGDRTVIEYPGAHHTLEFEPSPRRFLRDVRDWVERLSGSVG
jgi:alpha-beta hydrolase superfamily lysophospholipase